MIKTILYLVRHSETVGNVEKRLTGRNDYELTDNGKRSINLLLKKFKSIKIDAVYASTSKRAIKTIEPIARKNGIEIIEDENLCEMYFGIYDGWKWEDVNKVNPKIHTLHLQTNEIMEIPNQESTSEVANRMYKCIQHIASSNIGKNILIASHGVAIESFLRKVANEPFTKKIEEYSQHNCSVNVIKYNEKSKKFKIVKLNDTSHLK